MAAVSESLSQVFEWLQNAGPESWLYPSLAAIGIFIFYFRIRYCISFAICNSNYVSGSLFAYYLYGMPDRRFRLKGATFDYEYQSKLSAGI